MASLSSLEKKRLYDLLERQDDAGYILDFTNPTYAEFFKERAGINIFEDRYSFNGTSKGKRLRAFWGLEDDKTVGAVLEGMLELWLYQNEKENAEASRDRNYVACCQVVCRLLGRKFSDEITEDEFLKKDFGAVDFTGLSLPQPLEAIMKSRYREAVECHGAGASLSSIFMCGSILEGLLLGVATSNPKLFNQASACPKTKEGKSRTFSDWSLAQLIDVSHEVGLLRLDVKKFGHALRDFRNYVHPYEQMVSQFDPDLHTSEICLQVLKAAIVGLKKTLSKTI